MVTRYYFITKWSLEAKLLAVWEAIYAVKAWPNWWKGVLKVEELQPNDVHGINGINRYTWRSMLPYELSFNMRLTEQEPLKRLKGEAFGELEGIGEWLFSEKEGVVYVEYHWQVITNKAWMNYLSFMLKPAFTYNHDVVMRWGAKGLAALLQAKLISC